MMMKVLIEQVTKRRAFTLMPIDKDDSSTPNFLKHPRETQK